LVLDGNTLLNNWVAKFPPAVQETLKAKFADSTYSNYSIYFKKFVRFCDSNLAVGEQISIITYLSFLQEAVTSRKSYSTIKLMAASVNYFLSLVGISFLLDPYYLAFMQGANRRAPISKDKMLTWNPQLVLDYISSSSIPTDFLPIAHETLVLVLLASGLRLDDLYKMSEDVSFEPEFARIRFRLPRKCDLIRRLQSFVDLKRFPDSRLCPVAALFRFVNSAANYRLPGQEALFISSLGKNAAKETLRGWACSVFFHAGIRVSAGSSRSAVSSAAYFSGIKIEQILKAAGWSRESTFRGFYCRPIENVPVNLFPRTQ
jgi:hypothetical protein